MSGALPILGFGDEQTPPATTIKWADGIVIYRGILGDMCPETLAREKAQQSSKEELRQQTNVVLLEDWRQYE